ncbi:HTH-type transcriptional repressor NsrR [Actinoplanes lobatus]|uniref:HTH-type transcriptional repressor NsrR n=1 Tax=Actinoplanes lobatus TaxID=113568 RepID=A0A7W7HQL7_9ACTN|nr:Rrf2 family transcriptional regulator [Actinoplanes lobatus]MBB4754926.1 Rrf2 family nitric oxide-sensitive transcriptional repressor [Actinoplanes lobatus]GGN97017.1 HTH-type transcriptional repressor NsrR [Actinoplanes lobatus]GIE44544.1 HTH-type transcriptional repressor NsrR [Actinoplanes lobatus]
MRLNRSTDIGLRVLMLAAARPDDLLTIDVLADSVAVPRSHLAKVVQRLQHLGLLDTVRGRNGGVRLATGAAGASIGGLVRELEGDTEVVECGGETPCPLNAGCRLRGALRVAQEAFYASLDPITIGDLAAPPVRQVLLTLGRSPQ